MNDMPLISLQGVSKKYGHVAAIRNISFDVAQGSSLAIFGPNGAGKSTLLKMLSMQTRETSGKILFSGLEAKKLDDNFRAKFGVISHQPFLYDSLSAQENLEFYASLYGIKKPAQKAEEMLKKVDLFSRRFDTVRTFSRGMIQRVSIARALINDPEIVFLDEPYTGLDSVASSKLSAIIESLVGDKKTVLMVTHNLKTGFAQSTDIIIMKKGQIVYSAKKDLISEQEFEKTYAEHVEVSE